MSQNIPGPQGNKITGPAAARVALAVGVIGLLLTSGLGIRNIALGPKYAPGGIIILILGLVFFAMSGFVFVVNKNR